MLTLRKWISSLTVATVVSLAAAAGAAAADAPARTVKTWDLDLAKRRDVATLYERVRTAARDVCRAETERNYRATRMRTPQQWRERCERDAVAGAIREVGSPALAALHTRAPRVAADF